MSIFLEDLKAKALAATPGEWTLRDRGVICGGPVTEYFRGKGQPQIVMCCGGEQIGHEQKTANEHFIVAARPEVVLDLLERLENAESERDALKAELSMEQNRREAARKQEPYAEWKIFNKGGSGEFGQLVSNHPMHDGQKLYASPVPAQQAEVSVPDGWKLVPIKETMDMRGAGFNCCEVTVLKVVEIYAAMIDAAPEPPLHWSDCATNNGPAMEPGECDCGGYPPKEPPCDT